MEIPLGLVLPLGFQLRFQRVLHTRAGRFRSRCLQFPESAGMGGRTARPLRRQRVLQGYPRAVTRMGPIIAWATGYDRTTCTAKAASSSRTADITGRSADVQSIGPIKRNEQCSDNEEAHEQHPNRRALLEGGVCGRGSATEQ